MLTYLLSERGEMTLFSFICQCIRTDILSGNLPANYRLPSKRAFAAHHGISVITVENAYSQLMAEGFIYSVPKSGYYVSEIPSCTLGTWPPSRHIKSSDNTNYADSIDTPDSTHGTNTTHAAEKPDNAGTSCSPYHESVPDSNVPKMANCLAGLTDFTGLRTDPGDYPFKTVRKIINNMSDKEQEVLASKCPPYGMTDFRKAIAHHLREFRGLNVSYEQIITGAGAEYLYGLIIQLLGRDKLYGVENPGYKKIKEIYKAHGARCESISMDRHGIYMPQLKASGTEVIHISPSHHFPTGTVTPIGRRHELLAWANEADGRYIIEDDYDSELRHSGMPIPALMSIDTTERVIYFNTFSKTLASLRLGYMVLPMHLLERFRHFLSFYSCTVSNPEQFIVTKLMESGAFEKHVHVLENKYNNVRNAIKKTLKESPLSEYAKVINDDAGMHLLLELNTKKPDYEIKDFALSKGIIIKFLSDYHEGGDSVSGTVVLNYTGMSCRSDKDMNDIRTLMSVLHEAVTS